jgi:hypothetical protein
MLHIFKADFSSISYSIVPAIRDESAGIIGCGLD